METTQDRHGDTRYFKSIGHAVQIYDWFSHIVLKTDLAVKLKLKNRSYNPKNIEEGVMELRWIQENPTKSCIMSF